MEALANLFEEELTQAVEVKDPKAETQAMRAESEKNFAVVNRRFDSQWIITFVTTFGFTLTGAMMTVYHFLK